ncbi:MAG: HAD family phosphatase [Verrucomicrobia bacterium]|nr:HAD family phosphatase [Verrucomicrobiota bacterium]MBI3871129.1 HAD family phosphatase [Verrucomicrobiota bacterium]
MSALHREFKAVIFDMDGVIVNSEPLHEVAFLETFDELGYGDTHGIRFADYLGRSDRAVWNAFIDRHQPRQSMEELTDLKESRLIHVLRKTEPLFPDAPRIIDALSQRYPLAVASGSVHRVIAEVLKLRDLRRFFRAVVSAEDVKQGKPAPDIFLRTAMLLGVQPEECCVIEDTTAGVEAARAARMPVIAITNTYPAHELHRADLVVSDYSEIEKVLLRPQ